MKILLIMASDICYRSFGRLAKHRITNLEPVTLTTLAALVPAELNATIRIVDEGLEKGYYAGQLYDVAGIYCCTASADRAYALCRYWKMKGAYTVLGGPHPSLNPGEAAEHADSVVVGPGENNWPQLLRDFAAGIYKKIYLPDPSLPCTSPIPDRSVIGSGYTPVPSVIANRGCVQQCNYCTIQTMWRNIPHKRPIEEVVEEIKSLKSKYVLIIDPSPLSDKDYAAKLYKAIMPLKVWWGGLASTDIGNDREFIDLMVKSGCLALFIGFESFSQATINDMHKQMNRVEKYRQTINLLHEKGISIVAGIMLGGDGDTREYLKALPDIVDDLKIDLPRYAIMTPYPGTALFKKMEEQGRLLHRNWHLYDGEHVVFQPKNMSPDELQALHHRAWKRSFTMPGLLKRIVRNKTMPKWLYFTLSYGIRAYARKVVRMHYRRYDPEKYLHRL